ncbi:MAG: hypothetical protein Q4G63_05715 [Bacteroidia bacterium]|nr:hypothetical protein [Bacteroidia bacterium]
MKHLIHTLLLVAFVIVGFSACSDKSIIRDFQKNARDKQIIGLWTNNSYGKPHTSFRQYHANGELWTCFDPVYNKEGKIERFKTVRKSAYYYTHGDTLFIYSPPTLITRGEITKYLYKIDKDVLSLWGYIPTLGFSKEVDRTYLKVE